MCGILPLMTPLVSVHAHGHIGSWLVGRETFALPQHLLNNLFVDFYCDQVCVLEIFFLSLKNLSFLMCFLVFVASKVA